MKTFEQTLRGLEFPNLEGESESLGMQYGEATLANAYEMIVAAVGDGFELTRTNKTKVRPGRLFLQ